MNEKSLIEHLTEENNRLREELEQFKTAGVETHTDYRILIAALRADNEICTTNIDDCENCPQKRLCMHEYLIPAAADAIEKLLNLLDYEKLHADTFFDDARKFEKELERVKAERDAAINDIMSWHKPFFPCSTCAEFIKTSNTCKIPNEMPCRYKWRGLQEAALKEGKE